VKLPLFAALLLLSSVSGICEAQVAGCGVLQSQFLKDDPTAQAIASGALANYSMDDFALRLGMPWPGASTDVFAYRLLSAIRALGYLPGVWTFGGENPGLELLNKFQRLNGLAESSTITAASLLAIDAALARQEMREREIAPDFPLFSMLTEAPPNEPSRTHLAALFDATFRALPAHISAWNASNFESYVRVQLSGELVTDASGGTSFCSVDYYGRYLPGACTFNSTVMVLNDDFTSTSTFLHEYAHYLDRNIYGFMQSSDVSAGVIDTTDFYAISYDINDSTTLPNGWTGYRIRRDPTTSGAGDFVSSYSVGWGSGSYMTAYEDFAESFALYVNGGAVFRELARQHVYLKQKYDWLKQNVFEGVEYNTGTLIGLANMQARPMGSDGIAAFNVLEYMLADPDAVWDYDFPHYPGALPPAPQVETVTDAASGTAGPVVPGEVVTISGSGFSATEQRWAGLMAPTRIGGTRVLFNGLPAPLLYVSPEMLIAVVPYVIANRVNTALQVELWGVRSASAELSVAPTGPKLFVGSAGHALALNENGSVNGAGQPAKANSVVSLYATGSGPSCPAGIDGQIWDGAAVIFTAPLKVTLGGQAAEVVAGRLARGVISGVVEIQVRVPARLNANGAVPVFLSVGGAASQSGINLTVAQ